MYLTMNINFVTHQLLNYRQNYKLFPINYQKSNSNWKNYKIYLMNSYSKKNKENN